MNTNRPEPTDELFTQILELTGEHLIVPPMRDVASIAMGRINAEKSRGRATDRPVGRWDADQNERVWNPDASTRPAVEQRQSRRKELGLFVAGLASAAAVTLVLVFVFGGFPGGGPDGRDAPGAGDDGSGERVAYVVTNDFDQGDPLGEVIAVSEATNEVIARVGTGDQPSVAASPSGDRIYLLETRWANPRSSEHVLSVIDTSTWETVASTTIEGRVQYRFSGPPDLVLSPDGTRLFVLATDYEVNEEDSSEWWPVYSYWLDVYDATTLDQIVEPQTLMLPGCGNLIRLAETRSEIAVLCTGNPVRYSERPLYLVDPVGLEVRAILPLPEVDHWDRAGQPRDFVIADDGATAYAVANDGGIVEVDVDAREVARRIDSWKRYEETVYRVEPGNGDVILIGEGPDLDKEESDRFRTSYSITRIDLALMTELPPIELPEQMWFEAGPDDSLYVWEWGDLTVALMDEDGIRESLPLDLQYPPVDIVRAKAP